MSFDVKTIRFFTVFEPRCEKTGLRGFRTGPTQIRAVQLQKIALERHEISDLGSRGIVLSV